MGTVHEVRVLDHGYVRSVETWGSDEGIVEAARMSTQRGFEGWGPTTQCEHCGVGVAGNAGDVCTHKTDMGRGKEQKHSFVTKSGDEKLLAYLWKNKHHTPFEMAGLTVEVQAPIFVVREWHRHRVPFSYNEASARYAPLPDLNYVPTVERLMLNSKTNKQAGTVSGAEELTEAEAEAFRQSLVSEYEVLERMYQSGLRLGVPKELARVLLPVGRYTRMRASSNVRGWLNFLALRAEPHAQWEIQQFAWAVHGMLSKEFPRTLALFDEGRK